MQEVVVLTDHVFLSLSMLEPKTEILSQDNLHLPYILCQRSKESESTVRAINNCGRE
jgi:hypothetical protein